MDAQIQLETIVELADAYFLASDDAARSGKTAEEFEIATYVVRYNRGLLRAAVNEVKAGWS